MLLVVSVAMVRLAGIFGVGVCVYVMMALGVVKTLLHGVQNIL